MGTLASLYLKSTARLSCCQSGFTTFYPNPNFTLSIPKSTNFWLHQKGIYYEEIYEGDGKRGVIPSHGPWHI